MTGKIQSDSDWGLSLVGNPCPIQSMRTYAMPGAAAGAAGCDIIRKSGWIGHLAIAMERDKLSIPATSATS